MKLKFVELNSFLKGKVADSAQFTKAVSIALGVAVGRIQALPSALSEQAHMFYSKSVQAAVERAVADFNENIIVDVDLAAQTARSIWLVRAGLAFPQPMIDLPGEGENWGLFSVLSGQSHTLSPETLSFISANQGVIFVMANRITAATSVLPEEERRQGRGLQVA